MLIGRYKRRMVEQRPFVVLKGPMVVRPMANKDLKGFGRTLK